MATDDYLVTKKESASRLKTTIQHKLRRLMKCYTVYDFSLDKKEQTFSFKKCYIIREKMMRIEDKRHLTGRYEIEEIDDEYNLLKLFV